MVIDATRGVHGVRKRCLILLLLADEGLLLVIYNVSWSTGSVARGTRGISVKIVLASAFLGVLRVAMVVDLFLCEEKKNDFRAGGPDLFCFREIFRSSFLTSGTIPHPFTQRSP